MNLLVCDDSSFARKQIIRALPASWEVDIHQAGHGGEAMDVLAAGDTDVLILDLNMPVMDGFQVLEQLQGNDRPRVIVVSGDIQPEAKQRVMRLGAAAFLRKPLDGNALLGTLEDLGLLQDRSGPARNIDQSVEAWDSYREIANVAVGRAADLLARYLGVFVQMPLPSVRQTEPRDLQMILTEAHNSEQMSVVCQSFIGAGIAGEVLLITNEAESEDFAALMNYQGEMTPTVHRELLMEVSSLLISAAMQGLGEQLDIIFSMGHPVILDESIKIDDIVNRNAINWKDLVMIEMDCGIEDHKVSYNLLIFFTHDSIEPLNSLVDYLAN